MADEAKPDEKPAPTPTPTPAPTEKAPDLKEAAKTLVEKHGDANAAVVTLLNENYKSRDTIRDLKAKVPAEGAVVLTGDDVKAWQKYNALGKPSDLEKGLNEGNKAKTTVAGYRKAEHNAKVAEVAGFKPTVLATLAKDLDIEIRDAVDKDGKPVKDKAGNVVREAVVKGEGDTVTPLAKYAETNWADFLPSLKGDAPKKSTDGSPLARAGLTPPKPPVEPTDKPKRSLFG